MSGKRLPTLDILEAICRATGASADWLLGLTDRPDGSSPAGETSASYGSAIATNGSTASAGASPDAGRLIGIIESQQTTIAALASALTQTASK